MQQTHDVLEQAIEWYVKHETAPLSLAQKQDFEQWLNEHDCHQQAWQQVTHSQQIFTNLPLSSAQSLSTITKANQSRRHVLKSIAALSISSWLTWRYQKELGISAHLADHHAQIGEQLQLTHLAQAKVALNTHSAINLDAKTLWLKYGEAHIVCQVPLAISSPHCHFNAESGGEFILFDDNKQVRFSALNQRFDIVAHGQNYTVDKDHTLIADRNSTRIVETPRHMTSWTKGMLSVSQMPLKQFIAELSRYLHGSIRVAPAAAQLHISGTFSLTDPKQILSQILHTFPELTLNGVPNAWQVINKKT
ncbi:DUF4880 domain-containing protein [Pseudoalteromonas luteoviolacea]|uniref:DUF4880 domain-containing protein n=1 Tax=Pseudoalteromonas luteoviolacea TaxID=43657 RepID=UPI001F3DB358|nr:DUF4880 domain-containing protein [Pseudoalteromonas luteoviolacea]MCF6441505.1 DUF4880 domain-containing protein [Pseudoalteromonas luteoviolacea]